MAASRLDGSLATVRDLTEEGKGYVLQLQVVLSRLDMVNTAQEAKVVGKRITSRVEQVEGWKERCGRTCGDGDDGDGALSTSCQVCFYMIESSSYILYSKL